MLKEAKISRIIKSEDLNHHGTLFAGRMSEWFVEGCLIAAIRLHGKTEEIVCVLIHGMNFTKPAQEGDIIELKTRIAHLGGSSITAYGEAFVNDAPGPSVTGMTTFVTVDENGRPIQHGLSLSEDYIDQNREIYEAATNARARR